MTKQRLLAIVISLVVAAVAGAAMVLSLSGDAPEAPGPVPAPLPAPEAPPSPSPAPRPPSAERPGLITVTSPQPGESVRSPLTITGEARGTWYFEASFPVKLLDSAGQVVAIGHAEAQGDWMTTEFVPFVAVLTFDAPATADGMLVLEKDNPSGLPEHADELRFPVRFPQEAGAVPPSKDGCRRTGCSGQVCAAQDTVTTCEFRAEYACYRTATCERQADGGCGWTMTPELSRCLAEPPRVE